MTRPNKVITIAILAMGGEGGGVLADWIVDLAEQDGFVAQTTSVPGVAQRTGATIYYVEIIGAAKAAETRPPVLSLMPVPGHVDIVIASELMEAGRAVQRGLVTPDRTTLITSTHRVYSMTEKIAQGDGRIDSRQLLDTVRDCANRFVCGDYALMADKSGSVISAVLFGVLAGSKVLPFSDGQFEETIRRYGIGVESSVRAFTVGKESLGQLETMGEKRESTAIALGPDLAHIDRRIEHEFPPELWTLLRRSVVRLACYQDPDYASEYLDRLQRTLALGPDHGERRFGLLAETARHLALWMSYEDAIRVADLKIQRTRFERVAQEAACSNSQVLEIEEFLHPRVEEIADILPPAIGCRLTSSDLVRRLVGKGRILRTTSVGGYLQLYAVACLRPWRRRSTRFLEESRRIDRWLSVVVSIAKEDRELAIAVTECQRLLKGYGDTHRRGRESYDAVIQAIPRIRSKVDPAKSMRMLISAALADEHGQLLEQQLDAL